MRKWQENNKQNTDKCNQWESGDSKKEDEGIWCIRILCLKKSVSKVMFITIV